jgi:hypothetical protein
MALPLVGPRGMLTHLAGQSNLDVTVLGDATVGENGQITAHGKGYLGGQGPGKGGNGEYGAGGAGYGDAGATSGSKVAGGSIYGSETGGALDLCYVTFRRETDKLDLITPIGSNTHKLHYNHSEGRVLRVPH